MHGDAGSVDALLAAGADPSSRTRIDDLPTPAEDVRRAGHAALAARLRATEGGRPPT